MRLEYGPNVNLALIIYSVSFLVQAQSDCTETEQVIQLRYTSRIANTKFCLVAAIYQNNFDGKF